MPEIVGFVSAVHQDEPGSVSLLLPPGIDEPDVLMVIVECANYAAWHGSVMHGMEMYGWHWLSHSAYCCTSPQAAISVSSRKTTQYDTFVGDGTDTVYWPVSVSDWQRKWIAIWAIRDADGPIAQGGQGFNVAGPAITPPWLASAPSMSLSGVVIPVFYGPTIGVPPNYAQDGTVLVDTIDNPSGPDYGGFYATMAHWSHTASPTEARPDWYLPGLPGGSESFYSPGFHIIVPEKDRGVCYSWPESDAGKNVPSLPHWESRCWEQRDSYYANVPLQLSGFGTLRLIGVNEYNWDGGGGENPGSDLSNGGVYQCKWPFAPDGPYNTPHIARIKFKWHPVGTIYGPISARRLRYAIANAGFDGRGDIHFPTTSDPYLRLTTGPWDDPTNALISAIAPDTDHILEVDLLTGGARVKLALAENIDAGPYLTDPPVLTVPYHSPYDQYEYNNAPFPVMQLDMWCSTNDILDVLDIEIAAY